jgi:EAL domain-containing protein (putative c-di-GMP-specific phosphodiesterase class I)/FixJ family two-component response regulator
VQAQTLVADMRPLLEKIEIQIRHQLDGPTAAPEPVAAVVALPKKATLVADLRILIVDDDPLQANFLSSMLKELGVNTIIVNNEAERALVLMRTQQFDVLFCDLRMPGMDGIEFLRLAALQNFKGAVVLVSEMDASVLIAAEHVVKEHGLNYCDTLKKPVSEFALKSLLARVEKVEDSTFQSNASAFLSEDDLRSGLAADAIELYYQPKVSLLNRRLLAVECLARWRHPTRGMVSPEAFVPELEQHGLIDEFTFAVIRKAAAQLAVWIKQGFDFKVAVNVSMNNINRRDIPEKLESIVRDAGVSPEGVIFEMTETQLMGNLVLSLEILTRLRLKGFGLSVDDFGTGFSSMKNLKQLPFSELKIDRAFVRDSTHDKSIRAVLESSTQLGKLFKLDLVAEGVETQEDWDIVSQAGCDAAQGYFIAKPMPEKDFIDWKIKWESTI